jgi:hypothetical protein
VKEFNALKEASEDIGKEKLCESVEKVDKMAEELRYRASGGDPATLAKNSSLATADVPITTESLAVTPSEESSLAAATAQEEGTDAADEKEPSEASAADSSL